MTTRALRKKIALELWHRWAPGHHEEWGSEPHKDEYLLAADAVIAIVRTAIKGEVK